MGRMTRAKAAEVAERLHVDEDAVLDLSQSDINPATPDASGREVLGNIAPNSAEGKEPVELMPRKTRGKRKGRKAAEPEPEPTIEAEVEPEKEREEIIDVEAEAETQEEQDVENLDHEAEDEALETTTNETMERLAKLRITSLGNQGALQASAVPEVEQDRSMADVPEATETSVETLENTEPVDLEQATAPMATSPTKEATSELPNISIAVPSQQQELEGSAIDDQTALEAPSSPLATAMPKVIKGLRTDTPSKRSTSNKENVEPVEPVEMAAATSTFVSPDVQPSSLSEETSNAAAITQAAASPSASHISDDKTENPSEALDIQAEAVDKTNLETPNIPASPEMTQISKPTAEAEKPKKAKPAPVVRLTKAAAARLSMAQGTNKDASKAPASTRPRPSIAPGRTGNVRQSVAPAAANKRVPPTANNAKTPATKTSPKPKKETTIPHSKPRPVSLSFPTPPPAAKSSKAPTKSTFQLPGEAVAAKLKAAREERAKREATAASSKTAAEDKKPAFKARPVPSTLKKTPIVRHTAVSRARDPAKAAEAPSMPAASTSTSTTGLKRSNTVATSKPRPSAAAAPTSSTTTKSSPPSTLTVQKRPRPSSMHVSKSTAATATAPRNPSISSSSGAASTARNTSGATSNKGKEVYARFGAARDAAETEKKEKEDAARKARAAAAERGRAASREWAEKQRVKKMVAKVEGEVAKAA